MKAKYYSGAINAKLRRRKQISAAAQNIRLNFNRRRMQNLTKPAVNLAVKHISGNNGVSRASSPKFDGKFNSKI